jgi:sugar phosphate isomerase/epimerase
MTTRRNFLTTVAAGLGVAAVRPSLAVAASTPEIKTALSGPVGLQLWSLRNDLPKDVPGTLARVRDLGIRHVETAGIPKGVASAADFRQALDKADLVCSAGHMGFARLRDDAAGAVAELKTLGARYAVCPWIDHDNKAGFNLEGAVKAASVFNAAGQAAAKEGLKFAYHCHGYEFVPSPDGTLFDTIVKNTDPALVGFEIDLFWAKAGGADPARLIASLPGRVPLMHIKDMKKDLALPAGSSGAPEDSDVAAGTGQLDFPAIFKAAIASKMEYYFIEDESTKPWDQLPLTLAYLKGLTL